MENICSQCHKDISTIEKTEILNAFNIANLDYNNRSEYCSVECVKEKVKSIPEKSVISFPFVKIDVIGFYQSKNGEFAVIVDL